jgi:hypothetical protein
MEFGASIFFTDYSITPAELAVAMEERGFDSVWAAEHSHIPVPRRTRADSELGKRYYDVMDLPGRYRSREAARFNRAEITVFEQSASEPPRSFVDQNRVWRCQGLQTRGEVRRLADYVVLGSLSADDDHARGDADARLKLFGQLEVRYSVDHGQGASRRSLGIVFAGARIAEIDQDPVAHISRDKALEPFHDFGDRTMIGGD